MSNKPVPYSPLSQAHIKQLQEQQEPYPEPEPEPSSEREPLAVLPNNLENPVFSFCTNNACVICPVKTVVKVGEFYVCFPAKDISKDFCKMQHWHSKNNLCFTVKENI